MGMLRFRRTNEAADATSDLTGATPGALSSTAQLSRGRSSPLAPELDGPTELRPLALNRQARVLSLKAVDDSVPKAERTARGMWSTLGGEVKVDDNSPQSRQCRPLGLLSLGGRAGRVWARFACGIDAVVHMWQESPWLRGTGGGRR